MASSASSASAASTSAAVFQTVYPREYVRAFLREAVRADGRGPLRARKTTVLRGPHVVAAAHGAALVRVGATAVMAAVTAEIAEPRDAAPRDGYLVVNMDLLPMASPQYRPGPPSSAAQVLSQRLTTVIVSSGLVPLDQLVVEAGKAVWVLHVDLVCLNSDGGLFDAGLAAAVAALRDVRLPTSRYDAEKRQVVVTAERTLPLAFHGPMMASVTFVRIDDTLLVDPTDEEERLADAEATAVALPDGRLVGYFQTSGTRPLTREHTEQICTTAAARAAELTALIDAARA